MKINLESPDQEEVIRLINELDDYQKPLYPPESHHGVDMAVLTQPNVIFAVVRDDDGQAIGCGAVYLTPAYGELKRMYLRPQHRGQGIARVLLEVLETEARARGCTLFTLETGVSQPEALALYARAGYERCEPFGDYSPDPFSVFMRKDVSRTPESGQ